MYKGKVLPHQVSASVGTIKSKRTIQFVDWCPTGFKCGINYQLPKYFPDDKMPVSDRALLMMSNSTAIEQYFSRLNLKYFKMSS